MKMHRLLIGVFLVMSGYLFYNGDFNGGSGYLCAVIAWITLGYAEKKYEVAADELEKMYTEGVNKLRDAYDDAIEESKREVQDYMEKVKNKYAEALKSHMERTTK